MDRLPEAETQLPGERQVFLDHVGHFVSDIAAAANALKSAGFAPTPVSVQVNEGADGAPQPAGTGNVTVMLAEGYIEALFKTADTPLGREFDAALGAGAGVRLIALSSDDARREHQRLGLAGFRTRPLVGLRRPVSTQTGEAVAAFTVARVETDEMKEGRVQFLTHHSERAVWQPRWLAQPNGAVGLLDVAVIVSDVAEASARFARFAGRPARAQMHGALIALDRGGVCLVSSPQAQAIGLPQPQAAPPFIAGYGLLVSDLSAIREWMRRAGISPHQNGKAWMAPFPPALGAGAWVFVEAAADLPWRRVS